MKTFQQQVNEINRDLRKDKKREKEVDIKKNIDRELEDKLESNGCEKFYLFYSFKDIDGDIASGGVDNFAHSTDGIGMIKLMQRWFDKLFSQSRYHILHGVLSPYFNDSKYVLIAKLKLDGSYHLITNAAEYEVLGIFWVFETRVAGRVNPPLMGFMGN